jgi:diguanylate cyclase (GGDEF)-like protein
MDGGKRPLDASLIRRRQRLEVSAMAARGTGLIATLVSVASWAGHADSSRAADLMVGGGVAALLMAVATVVSGLGHRRAAQPGYPRLRKLQGVIDGVVITGAVVFFTAINHTTCWPLLVVPILIASFQSRARGAVGMWLFTTTSYAGGMWLLDGAIPADLAMVATLHLVVGIAAGTQGAAFARQVEELDAARAALRHQASHDALTGLANRSHVAERAAAHAGGPSAVLLLDLNDFKQVNDTLGHAAGDELLCVVGARLQECVRPGDVVGRLGGDEFVILLFGADTAAAVADRIRRRLAEPVRLAGVLLSTRASIGVAVRPPGASIDLATLTARADAAMYADKTALRNDPGPDVRRDRAGQPRIATAGVQA